ncbi:hypothetical protein [Acidithiobacillus ferridurans]|uniref:hypothetical protein n=1 Tax=Acidithiobacillus ferridurans TaxID=1232575 RepID=UPI0015EF39C6|nr:hypothetical protein [Acidithiobacillus ferridurans]
MASAASKSYQMAVWPIRDANDQVGTMIISDRPAPGSLKIHHFDHMRSTKYPAIVTPVGLQGTSALRPQQGGASEKGTPQASCKGYEGLITLAGLQNRKGMGVYQRGFSGGKRLHVATDQLNVIPTITFVGQHLEFKHSHGYCSSIRCSNRQRLFSLTYSTSG